ncbi:transporter [Gordonia zhaorongruii]|uniref:PH-like domain-containing protein n=1 Tax=Gordonia zhaorongruii TaxID=2597659 RepID=UPI001043CFFC|nr:transporter [Gordonia zhaorongruii]
MSTWLYYTLIVLGALAVWLTLVLLVLRGWRNRGRRQEQVLGEFPVPPAEVGDPVRGPHTGLYVGSTVSPSWQDRVAVGDYGDRASCDLAEYPEGLLISRQGASPIWIPSDAIVAVRPENGLAGKVMSRDGVLVIRWTLPSGVQLDSGVRGDDKSVYPEWAAAYAALNERAFAAAEAADQERAGGSASESGTEMKKEK